MTSFQGRKLGVQPQGDTATAQLRARDGVLVRIGAGWSMEMQSRLPVGVAAFVGRERERAKLADLVTDTRVVTLTGSGGCGKTRLAVEVAGDIASRFSDGGCWVDCRG